MNGRVPGIVRGWINFAFWFTLVVILAGSVVRTTSSGLGCPDWPRCFGKWIPPTSISELPLDYKIKYQVAGREIADFEAFKTWTEYLNRLVGALLGMVLVGLSAVAVAKRRALSRKLFWGIHAALGLVIFQGALGAIVVATHLHGQTISLHLALAMGLAVLLARLHVLAKSESSPARAPSKQWQLISRVVYMMAVTQIVLGTEVRKSIDHLVHDFVSLPRAEWALHLSLSFLVHRSFSLLFVLACLFWYWRSFKEGLRLKSEFVVLGALVATSVATGVILRELGFPTWAQPAHLVLATLMLVRVDLLYRRGVAHR